MNGLRIGKFQCNIVIFLKRIKVLLNSSNKGIKIPS